jgi:Spy/CpxP family protein refolding chaperone
MRITSILAGALALAGTLSAQIALPPATISTFSPPIAELKQYLNLTDSQVSSLESIVQQKTQAQQQISAQISQKYQALQALLQSPSPDPNAVGQIMIDIQNLQKKLTPSTEPYHTEALAVLTPSQATLLANLNTALQLQTAANEAVNVNLLVRPNPAGIVGVLTPFPACPIFSGGIPLPLPGGPILPVPAPVLPLPPPGQ